MFCFCYLFKLIANRKERRKEKLRLGSESQLITTDQAKIRFQLEENEISEFCLRLRTRLDDITLPSRSLRTLMKREEYRITYRQMKSEGMKRYIPMQQCRASAPIWEQNQTKEKYLFVSLALAPPLSLDYVRRRTTTDRISFHTSSFVQHTNFLFIFKQRRMTVLRVFPFIGAAIGIAAVVLSIIGVSTTYWFSTSVGVHAGLWDECNGILGCTKIRGGRPAALAITVSRVETNGSQLKSSLRLWSPSASLRFSPFSAVSPETNRTQQITWLDCAEVLPLSCSSPVEFSSLPPCTRTRARRMPPDILSPWWHSLKSLVSSVRCSSHTGWYVFPPFDPSSILCL